MSRRDKIPPLKFKVDVLKLKGYWRYLKERGWRKKKEPKPGSFEEWQQNREGKEEN